MLNKKEISELRADLEDFKPIMGFFEKDVLLPGVKGRLEYIISVFESFKVIATKEDVAVHIDAVIKKTADEGKINIQMPEPKVGQQYLNSISTMLDNEYIDPIKKFLEEEFCDVEDLSTDFTKTVNCLNSTKNLIQSIISCRETLFKFHMKDFPNLKHKVTGNVIIGEPVDVVMVLMPFETRLKELVNIVQTTIESIDKWGEGIRDQRNKNVDLIVKMSEIKSIKETQKQQQFLLVLSVVFIILGFIIGTTGSHYLEKYQLKESIDDLLIQNTSIKKEIATLKGSIELEQELSKRKKNKENKNSR